MRRFVQLLWTLIITTTGTHTETLVVQLQQLLSSTAVCVLRRQLSNKMTYLEIWVAGSS